MKAFIIRAITRVGRFFWSWGFLKFVVFAVTLVIFLYAEEDWRGACAWAATKAKWEANGETFDYAKFIPPPVPDDENLAAIPLFRQDKKGLDGNAKNVDLEQWTLRLAMRFGLPGNNLPVNGNYMTGQRPDWEKVRAIIAENYAAAFPSTTPPADMLAQFDALYPFMAELRAASATRPVCRIDADYGTLPPFARALGMMTDPIPLSKILTWHARVALREGHSDQALEDLKINYKVLTCTSRDPTLVGGLVSIGVNAISVAAIYDGLADHQWNDAQLAELGRMLARVNFLAVYVSDLRSEAVCSALDVDAIKNTPQFKKAGIMTGLDQGEVPWVDRSPYLWPDGWWDLNKTRQSDFMLRRLAEVDIRGQLVYRDVHVQVTKQINDACTRCDASLPWNYYFTLSAPNFDGILQKFAFGQTWVDEARIACAVEQYRLAHGSYPPTLALVAKAYFDDPPDSNEMPHDVMNGQPFHYKLRSDGTFLLYSVGWNQVDDGGVPAFKKDEPTHIDYDHGDWVWPSVVSP